MEDGIEREGEMQGEWQKKEELRVHSWEPNPWLNSH